MDRNSTHICGYHFTMSPEGQWNSDGYRYTYSGPCGLKVHMECAGSSMMIPHPDAVIDASFTLPLKRNPIPGVGVSFPPVQSDVAGPSSGRRTWPDVVDAPSSSRAFRSDGRGAGSCKKSPELRLSSPPNYASGIWHHDMELDDEEEDEVIELVEVESSVEVINLVSDSEEEEDPSEGRFLDHCRGRNLLDTAQKVVFEFRNLESNFGRAIGLAARQPAKHLKQVAQRLTKPFSKGFGPLEQASKSRLGEEMCLVLDLCRLGNLVSLGRARLRLGENVQDLEVTSGDFSLEECVSRLGKRRASLGRQSLPWARMTQNFMVFYFDLSLGR
ncbi:unnamed protein product [Lupinus luteus]|uniref:Uncharacterized protein n=1 Tax=Lupinus luteus TaxID=3873 RepID=A0AAV1XET8_LUPLU